MDHSHFMKKFIPSGFMEYDHAINQINFLYPHKWCLNYFFKKTVCWFVIGVANYM
jgi:hypothetical protein